MNFGDFLIPFGITTYSLLAITAISGLMRIKLQRHKLLALIAVLFATLHAGLVIYLNYFAR